MTIVGKIIFIFIIALMYSLSFLVSRNSSIKAFEKLFIIFFTFSLIFSIIFSDQIWILLPKLLRVYEGSDSVLYLFIIVSTSCNIIMLRKIIELEDKISKLVQNTALKVVNTKKKNN